MTEERRWDNAEWPDWLNQAWNIQHGKAGSLQPANEGAAALVIVTLEGNHNVSWGDWIIRGIKGDLYPCKPDIFAATYDLESES